MVFRYRLLAFLWTSAEPLPPLRTGARLSHYPWNLTSQRRPWSECKGVKRLIELPWKGRWQNGNQPLAFQTLFSTINITILIVCINLQTANLPKCHYIALIRHK